MTIRSLGGEEIFVPRGDHSLNIVEQAFADGACRQMRNERRGRIACGTKRVLDHGAEGLIAPAGANKDIVIP